MCVLLTFEPIDIRGYLVVQHETDIDGNCTTSHRERLLVARQIDEQPQNGLQS
jgi:hypothetical protein